MFHSSPDDGGLRQLLAARWVEPVPHHYLESMVVTCVLLRLKGSDANVLTALV